MSNEEVPKTMRAVVLEKWKAIPVVKNIPVPEPKQGEVLVKVMACPINPMVINNNNNLSLIFK